MANIENLKTPTSEQAREYGSKGGIASAKAREEKRLIQKALQDALSGLYTIKDGDKESKKSGYDAMAVSMVREAINGNVKAFVAVRDSVGEKPKEILGVESESITGIKIKFVDKSNINKRKEKDPKIVGDYTAPTNVEEE